MQHALDGARNDLQDAGIPDPTYYLMPSAAYTVPFLAASPVSHAD